MVNALTIASLLCAAQPMVVLQHTDLQLPSVARGKARTALVAYGFPESTAKILFLDDKLRPVGEPRAFVAGFQPVIAADGDAWLVAYEADRPSRGSYVAKLSAKGALTSEVRLGKPELAHGDRVELGYDDAAGEGLVVWSVNLPEGGAVLEAAHVDASGHAGPVLSLGSGGDATTPVRTRLGWRVAATDGGEVVRIIDVGAQQVASTSVPVAGPLEPSLACTGARCALLVRSTGGGNNDVILVILDDTRVVNRVVVRPRADPQPAPHAKERLADQPAVIAEGAGFRLFWLESLAPSWSSEILTLAVDADGRSNARPARVDGASPAGWLEISAGARPILSYMQGDPNEPHDLVVMPW